MLKELDILLSQQVCTFGHGLSRSTCASSSHLLTQVWTPTHVCVFMPPPSSPFFPPSIDQPPMKQLKYVTSVQTTIRMRYKLRFCWWIDPRLQINRNKYIFIAYMHIKEMKFSGHDYKQLAEQLSTCDTITISKMNLFLKRHLIIISSFKYLYIFYVRIGSHCKTISGILEALFRYLKNVLFDQRPCKSISLRVFSRMKNDTLFKLETVVKNDGKETSAGTICVQASLDDSLFRKNGMNTLAGRKKIFTTF